tara:strand:- start:1385 stop:2680 length:1296 start_codon:yes stop_codon:yes gene_type:complete
MASSVIRSLGVAVESSVGSVPTGSNFPDASALSFVYPDLRRGSLTTVGEQAVVEQDNARSGPYRHPAEPVVTHDDSGNPQRLRMGSVTLTLPVRTIGPGDLVFTDYTTLGLHRLLASGFAVYTPAAATVGITASGGETEIVAGDADDLTVGQLLKLESNSQGIPDYSGLVHKVDATETLTLSPAFGAVPSFADDTLRQMVTYYIGLGYGAPLGNTVALVLDGDGWRSYLVGGRWTTARFYVEQRQLMVDLTVEGSIYDDHDNAEVTDPTEAPGDIAHLLSARSCISSSAIPADATGYGLSSTTLHLHEFELTVTNTLSRLGSGLTALGYNQVEIADVLVEGSITLSAPVGSYDDVQLNREHRQVMIGFGPGGKGQGAAIYLPAAIFTADGSLRDTDGDTVRQRLQMQQGRCRNDTSSNGPGNSHFRLGLTL